MKGLYFYILDRKKVIATNDMMEFAIFMEHGKRIVKHTKLPGDILVSTVFVGMNMNPFSEGAPVVFETMIFGGEHNDYCEKYSTWEEAEQGHQKAIEMVFQDVKPDHHEI